MTIGFTGTRHGCTDIQVQRLQFLLHTLKPTIVHHGACVGADRDFHFWAKHPFDRPRPAAMMWPSNVEQERWALEAKEADDVVFPIKHPLNRDRYIVDETEALIACPHTRVEVLRSGTWFTIRYARKILRPIYIIWCDGEVTTERVA